MNVRQMNVRQMEGERYKRYEWYER